MKNNQLTQKALSGCALSTALGVTMDWLWGRDNGETNTPALASDLPSARGKLLESKRRMATSALEFILKELKKK